MGLGGGGRCSKKKSKGDGEVRNTEQVEYFFYGGSIKKNFKREKMRIDS